MKVGGRECHPCHHGGDAGFCNKPGADETTGKCACRVWEDRRRVATHGLHGILRDPGKTGCQQALTDHLSLQVLHAGCIVLQAWLQGSRSTSRGAGLEICSAMPWNGRKMASQRRMSHNLAAGPHWDTPEIVRLDDCMVTQLL